MDLNILRRQQESRWREIMEPRYARRRGRGQRRQAARLRLAVGCVKLHLYKSYLARAEMDLVLTSAALSDLDLRGGGGAQDVGVMDIERPPMGMDERVASKIQEMWTSKVLELPERMREYLPDKPTE